MIVIFIFQTYKSIKNKSYIKSKKNKVKFNMFFFSIQDYLLLRKKYLQKCLNSLLK